MSDDMKEEMMFCPTVFKNLFIQLKVTSISTSIFTKAIFITLSWRWGMTIQSDGTLNTDTLKAGKKLKSQPGSVSWV